MKIEFKSNPNYIIPISSIIRIDITEIFDCTFYIDSPRTRAKETIRWFYGGKKGWRHYEDRPDNLIIHDY